MAQTATTLASVLKERWTDDEIQKQWLADDTPLSRIEQTKGIMIGKQAQTPVWGDLNSGGYTTIGAGGGTVNTPSNQGSAQAVWTLVYAYMPISLEISALNQSGSDLQSVISGKNIEIQGAIATVRNQGTRQLVTNGDSIVAQCASGGASTTVSLVASPSGTAYGYDAIVRNWLRPGAVIDIGTTADTDALATAATVTAVAESSTAPTITTGTSVTTTAGTHFVYIANPNSATAANPETNGLRNIVNTTGALGGLNPATAGQEYWAAASRDTATTVFSLDLALSMTTRVMQKTGAPFTEIWTSLKQQANYYSLLQNQVRFAGETNMGAGNFQKPGWGNMAVNGYPAILDSDWWAISPKSLFRVTGNITKPTWYSELSGIQRGMIPTPLTTAFQDQLVFAYNVGTRQRNANAGATGLTA